MRYGTWSDPIGYGFDLGLYKIGAIQSSPGGLPSILEFSSSGFLAELRNLEGRRRLPI